MMLPNNLHIVFALLVAINLYTSSGQSNSTQCVGTECDVDTESKDTQCPTTACDVTYEIEESSCDILLQNITATIVSLLPKLVGILENPLQIHISTDKSSTDKEPDEETVKVKLAEDCTGLAKQGNNESGVYTIQPLSYAIGQSQENSDPFLVYCDMETDGGGWTMFQKREDGSIDFYRHWQDYVNGFGLLTTEHWLGLKKLHQMTAQGRYELRVDMIKFTGSNEHVYAKYDNFRIGDENTGFKLLLGDYTGTAGDYLSRHANFGFSTRDHKEGDRYGNCAIDYKGAWWYSTGGDCYDSNLNGVYLGDANDQTGIVWSAASYNWYNLKATEMKIKRIG